MEHPLQRREDGGTGRDLRGLVMAWYCVRRKLEDGTVGVVTPCAPEVTYSDSLPLLDPSIPSRRHRQGLRDRNQKDKKTE